MNRRGFGAFGFAILFVFVLIMWPFVFAPMFNVAGDAAVAGGAVGVEAFFWSNLNLLFFITMVVIAVIYLRFGGGG